MIYKALEHLAGELEASLAARTRKGNDKKQPLVTIDNIAAHNTQSIASPVVITLLSTEEDTMVKNRFLQAERELLNGPSDNNMLNITVNVIISFVSDDYPLALDMLGHTIRFFQHKSIFGGILKGSSGSDLPAGMTLFITQNPITMEQVYRLWMVLGGKHYPFACYKVQMVNP